MRLLALTRYSRLGASSRMRIFQYLPWLNEAGIDVEVAPFFHDEYVRGIQQLHRSPVSVAMSFLRRAGTLMAGARGYDLLWIEKELLPWLPSSLDRLLLPALVPYVLDYDDAVFHYYDQHRSRIVRALLGNKHVDLIRNSALTITGNRYLQDYAIRAGGAEVEILPTVVDIRRYPPSALNAEGSVGTDRPVVGWVGQRSTARFLVPLAPLFSKLASENLASFRAIGIDAAGLGLPMDSVVWTEQTEVESIRALTIGLMPLSDDPFERGKCGYKLIQYMACGLPVVASPVGVNCQLVEHGVNGFLAETPEQWEEALRALISDQSLRARMGASGRAKVERGYTIQQTGPRLAQLLKNAASRKTGSAPCVD